jgi:hypothetical protein
MQKTTLTLPGIIAWIGDEIQGDNWKKRDFADCNGRSSQAWLLTHSPRFPWLRSGLGSPGGAGQPGIIIITYTPIVTASKGNMFLMF